VTFEFRFLSKLFFIAILSSLSNGNVQILVIILKDDNEELMKIGYDNFFQVMYVKVKKCNRRFDGNYDIREVVVYLPELNAPSDQGCRINSSSCSPQ